MAPVLEIMGNFFTEETKYFKAKSSGKDADPSALLRYIATDYVMNQPPDMPWGGVYKGHKGLLEWLDKAVTYVTSLEVSDPKTFFLPKDSGEESHQGHVEEIIVKGNVEATVKGTGAKFNSIIVEHLKIDTKAGVIDEVTPIVYNAGEASKLFAKAY